MGPKNDYPEARTSVADTFKDGVGVTAVSTHEKLEVVIFSHVTHTYGHYHFLLSAVASYYLSASGYGH